MENNFWNRIKRPFTGLAPMDGVTDAPFRRIVAKYGRPDLFITEFTSVEGICAGAIKPLNAFIFGRDEKPVVAQLFGSDPECFYKAFFVAAELGFDGIDINMGCPSRNIVSKGAGAELIKTPELAVQIIKECFRAAHDFAEGKTFLETGLPETTVNYLKHCSDNKAERKLLPVSVKTRTGYDKHSVKDWIGLLLEQKPATITVHGRTYRQLYSGAADWDQIALAAATAKGSGTLIIGNGDIRSAAHARETAAAYGTDGVLIGRAALGKPWIFNLRDESPPPVEKIFSIALEHSLLHEKLLPEIPFLHMRKHLAWYCRGFAGASEIRQKLMKAENPSAVKKILAAAAVWR